MLSDNAHQGSAFVLCLHGKPYRINHATSSIGTCTYRIVLSVSKSARQNSTVNGACMIEHLCSEMGGKHVSGG